MGRRIPEISVTTRSGLALLLAVVLLGLCALPAAAGSLTEVRESTKAMIKDAEDMVAHGGMGDAGAIVHHCGEVVKHAEAILRALPTADPRGKEAAVHLQEAIRYCGRVAALGDRVDPGVSLNPATKARTAVYQAAKHLQAIQDEGQH